MTGAGEAVFHCTHCGKGIGQGERMCSVNVHWETFDHGAITVHDAASWFIFCASCAGDRDFTRMTIPLRNTDPTRLSAGDAGKARNSMDG